MGDAFALPIGVVVTSKPHRASRASSLRGINGIKNRTAAAASSFAPYPRDCLGKKKVSLPVTRVE
jgi:hypothetical protein